MADEEMKEATQVVAASASVPPLADESEAKTTTAAQEQDQDGPTGNENEKAAPAAESESTSTSAPPEIPPPPSNSNGEETREQPKKIGVKKKSASLAGLMEGYDDDDDDSDNDSDDEDPMLTVSKAKEKEKESVSKDDEKRKRKEKRRRMKKKKKLMKKKRREEARRKKRALAKKKKRSKRNPLFEDEASLSGSGGSDDEDEENENAYDMDDGFLVGSDEEVSSDSNSSSSGSSSSGSDSDSEDDEDGGRASKKRKRLARGGNEQLDEEDLALIQENMQKRPRVTDGTGDGEQGGDADGDNFDSEDDWIVDDMGTNERRKGASKSGPVSKTGQQNIYDDLFGYDANEFAAEPLAGQDGAEEEYFGEKDAKEKVKGKDFLLKTFEPSVVRENYMYARDTAVQKKDMPERLQLLLQSGSIENYGQFSDAERLEEALWNLRRSDAEVVAQSERLGSNMATIDELPSRVSAVLKCFHTEYLEAPTVFFHRPDIASGFTIADLQEVAALDLRYHAFLSQIRRMEAVIDELVPDNVLDELSIGRREGTYNSSDEKLTCSGRMEKEPSEQNQPEPSTEATQDQPGGDADATAAAAPLPEILEGKTLKRALWRRLRDIRTHSSLERLQDFRDFVLFKYAPSKYNFATGERGGKKVRSKKRCQVEKLGLKRLYDKIGSVVKVAESIAKDESLYPSPEDASHLSPRDEVDELLAEGHEELLDLVAKYDGKKAPYDVVMDVIVKNIALDFFHEDRLREFLLTRIEMDARISTVPTKRGLDLVTQDKSPWNHPVYPALCVASKPVDVFFERPAEYSGEDPASIDEGMFDQMGDNRGSEFREPIRKTAATLEKCEQFLLIQSAVEKKMASVKMDARLVRARWYIDIAREFLTYEGYKTVSGYIKEEKDGLVAADDMMAVEGRMVNEWDKVRFAAMKRAFETKILKWGKHRTFKKLRTEAEKSVARKCQKRLFRMAMEGSICYPFQDPEEMERVRGNADLDDAQMQRVFEDPDDPEDSRNFRTMGVYLTSERDDECAAVVLEADGSVAYEELFNPVHGRYAFDAGVGAVKGIIRQYAPRVVVVNASLCDGTRRFVNELRRFNHETMRVWAQEDRHTGDRVAITYDDDAEKRSPYFYPTLAGEDVSDAYADSDTAKNEFPGKEQSKLKAISIGRYVQNPICEIARLWRDVKVAGKKDSRALLRASDNTILHLPLHPMQSDVNPALLCERLEAALISATAFVGIDVNDAIMKVHLRGPMQFVPGLGPRKVAQIAERLRRSGTYISSREQLKEILLEGSSEGSGDIVYNNACSFLLIRKSLYDDEETLNLVPAMDRTRIHPMHASVVRALCEEARNSDAQAPQNEDPVDAVMRRAKKQIESICKADPTWIKGRASYFQDQVRLGTFPFPGLQDLDTDMNVRGDFFNKSIASKYAERFRSPEMACMAIEELRFPFAERRFSYAPPPDARLFEWMTAYGSLRRGDVVTVKYVRALEAGARGASLLFRLPNDRGVMAKMSVRMVQDGYVDEEDPDFNVEKYVSVSRGWVAGDDVEVVVVAVKKKFFEIQLSARESDLNAALSSEMRKLDYDPHFDPRELEDLAREHRDKIAQGKRKGRLKFIPRTIDHPSYKNVGRADAEDELKQAQVLDTVVRPSTWGTDHIAFSWKYSDGEGGVQVVRHALAKEQSKSATDPLGLGSPLIIDGMYKYADIDDVIVNYITPLTEMAAEMRSHRKFRPSSTDEVRKEVMALKAANPKSIPYLISAVEGSRWKFKVHFIPGRRTVSHLNVEITPDGYLIGCRYDAGYRGDLERSGGVTKSTVDALCNYFKKYWKKLWEMANQRPQRPRDHHQGGFGGGPRGGNRGWDNRGPPPGGGNGGWGSRGPPPGGGNGGWDNRGPPPGGVGGGWGSRGY